MRKLTIDRMRWARWKADGTQPAGESWLLNEWGGMCCLGFDCKSLGVPDESLRLKSQPYDELPSSLPEADQEEAIAVNDRTNYDDDGKDTLTDVGQEAAIAAIFARNGVEVEFVN